MRITFKTPAVALLQRELLTALRRGWLFALLVFTLVLTFIIVVPQLNSMFRLGGSPEMLMLFFALGLHVLSLLFLPPLAAVSICTEKQRDTWPLLITSLAPPGQIVFAKILNVLAIFLLINIALLPIIGVVFFFVGLDIGQFINAFTVVFLSALATTAVSVYSSAYFYRTIPAIAFAYFATALINGGLVFLGGIGFALYVELLGIITDPDDFLVWAFSLVPAGEIMFRSQAMMFPVGTLIPYLCHAFLALVTLIAFARTLHHVRRPPRPPKVNLEKPIDDAAVLEQRRKKFPYYLVDPQRRRKPIPDGRNPMFAKELIAGLTGRSTTSIRIAYVGTILAFTSSVVPLSEFGMRGFAGELETYFLALTTALLVFAPAAVANTMAKEYELDNVDMLRMTLLTPRQVLTGKAFAACITLALPAAGMFIGMLPLLVASLLHFDSAEVLFRAALVLVVSLFLVLSLSLRVSVVARSTISAITVSYFLNLLLLVVMPLLVIVVMDFLRFRSELITEILALYPSPPLSTLLWGWDASAEPGLVLALLLACLFYWRASTLFRRQSHSDWQRT